MKIKISKEKWNELNKQSKVILEDQNFNQLLLLLGKYYKDPEYIKKNSETLKKILYDATDRIEDCLIKEGDIVQPFYLNFNMSEEDNNKFLILFTSAIIDRLKRPGLLY